MNWVVSACWVAELRFHVEEVAKSDEAFAFVMSHEVTIVQFLLQWYTMLLVLISRCYDTVFSLSFRVIMPLLNVFPGLSLREIQVFLDRHWWYLTFFFRTSWCFDLVTSQADMQLQQQRCTWTWALVFMVKFNVQYSLKVIQAYIKIVIPCLTDHAVTSCKDMFLQSKAEVIVLAMPLRFSHVSPTPNLCQWQTDTGSQKYGLQLNQVKIIPMPRLVPM